MQTFTIEQRKKVLVNTDPQRRCYNGVHFSSEWRWTEWSALNSEVTDESLGRKLTFWRELNDYAVNARGESARCEYRAVPTKTEGVA